MPDYGVTRQGFRRKRLSDILDSKRRRAVELFADLVSPGEVVDTSDSSLLGRLILLDAPGDAEQWEVMQQIFLAFDPNSATGVALDNLVALSGITRHRGAYSVATMIVEGERGTVIPAGEQVSSPSTGNAFLTSQFTQLSLQDAVGITLRLEGGGGEGQYRVTYNTGSTSSYFQYEADVGETEADILSGLNSAIQSQHPLLTSYVDGMELVVGSADIFRPVTFATTSTLVANRVRKTVEAVAVEIGPIEQAPNSITKIDTPILGWTSVTNPAAATVGRNRETDEELRLRFRDSKLQRASNIIDSLYSALISIPGVDEVVIYENDTSEENDIGLPPHSFLPVIVGGDAPRIGRAIWRNKPLGILSYGNTSVQVTDSQGFPHEVYFERPNPVVIYVTVNLTTNDSFPPLGEDEVKGALVEYFQEHFGVGEDVIYSRLYTAINSVPGHQVDSLFIGTSPSPNGTSNISIDYNQIASASEVNIIVNT